MSYWWLFLLLGGMAVVLMWIGRHAKAYLYAEAMALKETIIAQARDDVEARKFLNEQLIETLHGVTSELQDVLKEIVDEGKDLSKSLEELKSEVSNIAFDTKSAAEALEEIKRDVSSIAMAQETPIDDLA